MPNGTPIQMKCPKCRRGMFGRPYAPIDRGPCPTRYTGPRAVRSKHKGHGGGGSAFWGYPGLVRCRDCGHTWYSTHPQSGRVRLSEGGPRLPGPKYQHLVPKRRTRRAPSEQTSTTKEDT